MLFPAKLRNTFYFYCTLKQWQMKTQSLSLKISPSIGAVSAECIIPEKSKCIMTLAHGAGAGMNHSFMVTLAQLLSEQGIATLRFNFPFTENKKGRPDIPAVAHAAVASAIAKAEKLFPELPLFAAGKSFGGRMSSQYLSAHPDAAVKGIIFYGFPLHPPGKPSIERAEHLKEIKSPMLFLQGTKDELATWDLIESVCSSLKLATLIKIEGANHAFKAGKQNIVQLLADTTKDWMEKMIKKD
jgi:predicted alpha/beta-hydrolase family hydrolase